MLARSLRTGLTVAIALALAPSALATDVAGGTYTGAVTWTAANSPYVVKGNVTFSGGGSLTIQPGVEVRFDGNYALTIGGTTTTSYGTITAVGTAQSPITFRSHGTPGTGKWAYIRFQTGATTASILDHCHVLHAGSTLGAVYCTGSGANPTLSNLTIEDSGASGIYLNLASPTITGAIALVGGGTNLIQATSTTAQPTFADITASSAGAFAVGGARFWSNFFGAGPVLVGGPHRAEVLSDTVPQSATWGGTANLASIDLLGDLTISSSSSPVLTIAAGTVVRLPPGGRILVGSSSSTPKGDLVIAGTAQSPVRVERSGATAWRSIEFRAGSTSASSVVHCELIGGGSTTAAIHTAAGGPVNLGHLLIDGTATDGIYMSGSTSPAFTGTLALTNSSGYLLRAATTSAEPTFAGVSVSSSGAFGIGGARFWSNFFGSEPVLAGGPHRAEVYSDTVAQSGTWGGTENLASIDLLGDLTISNSSSPVLTIAAGTVVRLPPGVRILVGSSSSTPKGDLVIAGTAQSPVRVERSGATAWRSIEFRSGSTSASSIMHCELVGGGSMTAAIHTTSGGPVNLGHLLIDGTATDGIAMGGSTSPAFTGTLALTNSSGYLLRAATVGAEPTFADVTVSSSGGFGVGGARFWSNFFGSGPVLTGGPHRAEVHSDTVAQSATWGGIANLASIDLLGDLTISNSSSPVLTIAAGTVVRLPAAGRILVGSTSSNPKGDLVVAGTAQAPVRIERSGAAAWRSIEFRSGSTAASSVMHCELVGGGSTTAAIHTAAGGPVSLGHLAIDGSATDGVYMAGSTSPTFTGVLALTGSSGYLLRAATSSAEPTFTDIVASSSGAFAVGGGRFWTNFFGSGPTLVGGPYRAEVYGDTLTQSTTWGGLANLASIDVLGDLSVVHSSHPTLTLLPGTTMRFGSAGLSIASTTSPGTLDARGTPSAPIVFTSSLATPAPGSWKGVDFASKAGVSYLEHCVVEYGGAGTPAANVRMNNDRVVLRNCAIRHGSAAGLKITSGAPVVEFTQFIGNDCGVDALSGASTSAVVVNNHFSGNTSFGLRSASSAGFVASLNSWNDPSGPSGVGPGSGDAVSGTVVVEPWLVTSPTPGFAWVRAAQSPDPFPQDGGATAFFGQWNDDAAWQVTISDATPSTVRTLSGSGAVLDVGWVGDDGSSTPLPDGVYDYEITASHLGGPASAPAARGKVTLASGLPFALITSPASMDFVHGSVSVIGTAQAAGFSSYRLEYRVGAFPASGTWTTIVNTSTPVANGVLGTWNVANLNEPLYTLRLTVNTTGGASAQHAVLVRKLSLTASASPTHFSPNGDGIQDVTTTAVSLSWPLDWTVEFVPTSGGPAVRTFQGSGVQAPVVWDGSDDALQLVPDGNYDVVLRAAAPGLTPLPTAVSSAVVDTTAPVADVASPGHLAVELSSHPLDIRGSAHDVNFASYSLAIAPGNPPGSFATFASSQLAVTGVPPADLLGTLTTLAHSPGEHTLRLTVVDLAGNSTTVLRPFTLDYITVTDVSSTPKTILPEDNELVGVTFTVSHDCDADVEFYRWPECTLVRTVSASNLGAGQHTLLWDGRDAFGDFAPDRLNHFVVRVNDAAGRDGHFNDPTNPFRGTGASWGSTSITTSGFNAHRNDVIVVNYQVNGWLDCQITVQGSNLSVPLSPTGTFPPGPHVAYWDGRNQNGQIHTGSFNFYFGVPADLPHPSVFVKRGPTHFLDFRAQAYLIHPVFSQVSGVSYELTREATVSIVVQDPNGNHVKTLLPATLQNAGVHGLDAGVRWDGCDEAGRVVSLQGTYSIVLTAVDPLTGHAYTRRGAVRVYH